MLGIQPDAVIADHIPLEACLGQLAGQVGELKTIIWCDVWQGLRLTVLNCLGWRSLVAQTAARKLARVQS